MGLTVVFIHIESQIEFIKVNSFVNKKIVCELFACFKISVMSISRGWKPVYYLLRIEAKREFVLLFIIRGLVLERQIVVQSDRGFADIQLC